ncbi:MAG: hypothetical protein F6J92_37840, partial [Symploca sp. SIO1A3]|nr:hypothetical protein [Symploca sp. SIO1A3]
MNSSDLISESEQERLINALLHQLGIFTGDSESDNHDKICLDFAKENPEETAQICEALADLCKRAFQFRLGQFPNVSPTKEEQVPEGVWKNTLNLLLEKQHLSQEQAKQLQDIVRGAICEALSRKSTPPSLGLKESSEPIQPWHGNPQTPDEMLLILPPETTTTTSVGSSDSPKCEMIHQSSDSQEGTSPPTAQWKYVPLPENEPDKHDESKADSIKTPGELKLIGARVRGKKHKHEGTHCDDWFELAVSGDWKILAVSL